jgi:hypothetical protein
MMFSSLLAIGATLITSIVALPSAGGNCGFSATATQMCNHGKVFTSLTIPQIFIGNTAITIKPNNVKRTSLSKPWHVGGLAKDFVADFKNGSVVCKFWVLYLIVADLDRFLWRRRLGRPSRCGL